MFSDTGIPGRVRGGALKPPRPPAKPRALTRSQRTKTPKPNSANKPNQNEIPAASDRGNPFVWPDAKPGRSAGVCDSKRQGIAPFGSSRDRDDSRQS